MLRNYHFDRLKSSQDTAWEILESSGESEFSVTANNFEALRGRRGRSWEFDPDSSFCFSLAIKAPRTHLPTLSLICGFLCTQFFKELPIFLKWPNDLILDDQKVGGILIESRESSSLDVFAVIGVGINQFAFKSFSGIGKEIPKAEFLDYFYDQIKIYFRTSFEAYLPKIDSRLWRKNERLKLLVDSKEREVLIKGIDDQGRLVTEEDGKVSLAVNGELSLG